jgi:NADPH-dependent 7-cyano-7-deazaguanine reductase QueF-like protein
LKSEFISAKENKIIDRLKKNVSNPILNLISLRMGRINPVNITANTILIGIESILNPTGNISINGEIIINAGIDKIVKIISFKDLLNSVNNSIINTIIAKYTGIIINDAPTILKAKIPFTTIHKTIGAIRISAIFKLL